jgi:serine/threonine protein kinase
VTPGTLVDGKYRVDRTLGEGGMATVFAATHVHLDQRVAIKVLKLNLMEHPHIVERFMREARAAVRIKNPYVVRVLDVGTLPTQQPYIALEFLDGTDLAELMKQRGKLPVPEAVDYMLQLCDALAEAHVLGIVHRDVKPANCVQVEGADGLPKIKVLDFGIAKLTLDDGGPRLTATQTMMGTPAYMSPEQLRGAKDVDHRGDIWSVGIMLFELTTGNVPFYGNTFAKLLMAISREPTPQLPMLPPGLAAAIDKCLAKDREQRYQSIAELARDLEPFAGSRDAANVIVQRCMRQGRIATPPAGLPVQAPRMTPTPQPVVEVSASYQTPAMPPSGMSMPPAAPSPVVSTAQAAAPPPGASSRRLLVIIVIGVLAGSLAGLILLLS